MLQRIVSSLRQRIVKPDSQNVLRKFEALYSEYEASDFPCQTFIESSTRLAWHTFTVNYPTLQDFIDAPHEEKSAYLSKMANYIELLSRKEKIGQAPKGVTTGASLVQMWIAACAWNDFKVADYISERLEPLNRSAYETACAMGSASPDEDVIESWKELFSE